MGLLDSLKTSTAAQVAALEDNNGLRLLVADIKAAAGDLGFPSLVGDIAEDVAKLSNHTLKAGAGLAGSGKLAGVTLSSRADLEQILLELKEESKSPPTAPVAVRPDTVGLLPPDATAPTATPVAPPEEVEDPPPVKRASGRPKKTKEAVEAVPEPVAQETTAKITRPAPAPAPEKSEPAGLQLFVDCIPTCAAKSLDPYIDALCDSLQSTYGCGDIRATVGEGPLSFGKWKGVLSALVRETPPPPGSYTLDMRGRELAEVVADALRRSCTLYVRGIR